MSGLGGELLGKETTWILVDYVWVGDWWVSYLSQAKVHIQVLIMVGLFDMKMNKHTKQTLGCSHKLFLIKPDCIKSHQSVSL